MKVVRSQEELRSLHSEIDNEAFYSSLETDVKTIARQAVLLHRK